MDRSKMRIYDNNGKSVDRYTVVFMDTPETNDTYYALGMSAYPFHPQGIGLHCSAMPGKHLGKLITFDQLPKDCQTLVNREFE